MKTELSILKIFYFSGTGNAKNVAQWIGQAAEIKDVDIEINDIAKLKNRQKPTVDQNIVIGFVSPTHGFNYPPIMMHFVMRMPKANGNKVFLINTRAGMKLGKYFLPGLSGIALLLSAIVLLLKGYKIIGMQSIDLPSNWISIHPGIRESVVESIYIRRKKDTQKFAEKILSGKRVYKPLFDIVQDLLISPIAILYYLFGRFGLAKTFIASSDCTKCGLCIKQCPVKAIRWVDKRPFWSYKCESCMKCMNACPARAIETAHGYFVGILVFAKSVVIYQLYSRLAISQYFHNILPDGLVSLVLLVINFVMYFIILVVSYYVLHYLMRIKFIERIIVYTSFTSYKFWRRYKIRKQA